MGKTNQNSRTKRTPIQVEDDRTGLEVETLARAVQDNLYYLLARDEYTATARNWFTALAYSIRDRLVHRWIKTQQTYYKLDVKRVYYLSAEFLVGRSLACNLINLGLYEKMKQALAQLDLDLDDLLEMEEDAGLGNAGLGRLAACFMDSMATMAIPAYGYGIRYEYGIFDQLIKDGYQVERPDQWLRYGNPWEIPRPEYTLVVKYGGKTEQYTDDQGRSRVRWLETQNILGQAFDTPVIGYGCDTANTLRLWSARATQDFDLDYFNEGDYLRSVSGKITSENISKVLYPNDNSVQGKELRLEQQYFFVSCSIQDIVRRYLVNHSTFDKFPDKVAIQLNDTHPSIAIPELMRILMDVYGVPWDQAWDLTVRCTGYTNHTLLPEALERWPVSLFERLLPRHLEIIYEINKRFLEDVARRYPGNVGRLQRTSLIEEHPVKQVRMAHLAVVGSHSVNGVAALHTDLLRYNLLNDVNEMWPERFNNKTNGVTPRRWLLVSNPRLAQLITEKIGPGWVTDLEQLKQLEPLAEDPAFRARVREIKHQNKMDLAEYIQYQNSIPIDVNSLFDVQVKRLHEYKRQHLNVLHIISLYNRIKKNPNLNTVPRTFIFGAKAAPGYTMAKLIIKLINSVADVINNDPDIGGRIRVVYLANYRVSLAERIFPAADLSEQISTAGKEASGTGNMKFALNGALTIGTLDGANIEIREKVGEENFFLCGLTAQEVAALRTSGYNPYEYYRENPELREVLDMILSGHFSPEQPDLFKPIMDNLLYGGDPYMLLADFASYVACQEQVSEAFLNPEEWTRKAILNIARSGYFSSDRTIKEYAEEIWMVKPVKIVLEANGQKTRTYGGHPKETAMAKK
ncbi:MAG: glycogen/starch/alpha-glucan phosphorylase [Armatimonadetes bacterium]|nr:glycogen/starch/alpha-glucan phosphorylase [Armatimonadota bacterium]